MPTLLLGDLTVVMHVHTALTLKPNIRNDYMIIHPSIHPFHHIVGILKSYAIEPIFLLFWCPSTSTMICDHDPKKKIDILVRFLFLFCIILFNIMKLLATFFRIKLFVWINVFEKVNPVFLLFSSYDIWHSLPKTAVFNY